MSNKTLGLPDALYDYMLSVSLREPPILRQLRLETARMPMAKMQIAPEQGQFMALLVQLMGARKTLDIGVFTGYSALAIALALPPSGGLIACDINEDWTGIARRYWALGGVADKIDLRLAPALETLDRLVAEGQGGSFDFAFIDADKEGYADYFERCLALVRPGGLIAIDNVLWSGRVANPEERDSETEAIRRFNQRLSVDRRVTLAMVPVGDGLSLALKHG